MQRVLAALLVVIAATTGVTTPAAADLAQPAVVSEHPVRYTPHVLDGAVWAMTVVGRTVIVGGEFTKVADSTRRHTYARRNIFAFDLYDGSVRSFAPAVDGGVHALAAGPGDTVYAGGNFTTVNGVRQRGLARLSLSGDRVSAFRATVNYGDVRALAQRDHRVYAGGTFTAMNGVRRAGLARVDATTGALDTGFDARLSAPGMRETFVESFDLSPDGRRLVVVGALKLAGTTTRGRIAMFDVSGSRAALTDWYTDAFAETCAPKFDAYLRQVKFSPDGSYIVVVTTGGTSSPVKLCDAAARFQTAGSGKHDPVWVQHTGGNSLSAVAVTGAAVYLGGHQLYLDNPNGHKIKEPGKPPVYTPGPGAVMRPGIGAVDPATGRALSWNPTRSRGVGVRAFVAVPQGLLVGSDTDELGHEYHGRVGMFPLR
ncbi:PKD domain containing protein [Actinoplanes sp. CA-030573]|uniref:delta-60 repeat domain-containing protein n=1 Tax=Actinoplanes sp. CA-030573 TaxID=3239898 RepID=UPI003D921F51